MGHQETPPSFSRRARVARETILFTSRKNRYDDSDRSLASIVASILASIFATISAIDR
jgi:hypothetical protein